ncbi:TetR/AcrR family transcriptional regulator [Actinomadura rayongensis]|uniref:TetR family transcriptional regulator n=1 Tax=Actinomadura rayongensis TaxID=1429076 RepID=A0A6I4W7M0_9ACTN|nr:TetR/AcrR family transcriptional regulator [Actinomadura rayongensis]MXQ62702.1 TetR family transcriptional regulator [Actinomadura rayongensis]
MIDAPNGRPRAAAPTARGRGRAPRAAGPPGTARRDRREETRTALLAAAGRLWAEHGIHGASLDDIAAAAGLTKGAVYSNFTGKTDLVLALMERCTDASATALRNALPLCARFTEDAHHCDDDCTDGRLLALLLVEFWLYGMRDHAAGWRVADWWAEHRTRLAAGLPGDGPAGDAPARAALAVALDIGLAFQHLMDPDRVPADLYNRAVRLL